MSPNNQQTVFRQEL